MSKETNHSTENVSEIINQSFEKTGNNWRTIHGIARETGLSEVDIQSYIMNHSNEFIESEIKPGGDVHLFKKVKS
ncbi:MAG: hypothetical protein JJ966_11680 [Balneolaceae bacterium]|nr:hypothetical protein [Balneolaceae bacterium]